MRIIFTIITILFILQIIDAQRLRPFKNIEFKGLNPDWIVPIKDTVLAQNTTIDFIDEYNSITSSSYLPEILLYKDLIFQTMLIGGGIPLGGCLIECRSVNSGELVWQKRYGLYADGVQTALRLMRIDTFGRLVVMGQKKKYPIDSPLNDETFLKMFLFEEVYNPFSGEIIESSQCNYEDEFTYPTRFSPFEGGVTSGAFFFEGENYRHYEYRRVGEKRFVRSFLLDKCGQLLSDSLNVQVYDNIDNVDLLEIGSDTIMILSKKYLPQDSMFAFNFKFYTRDLVPLDSILTPTFPNYMVWQKILGLSKDRKKILIKWSRWDNDNPLPPVPETVGVFDLKGNLLKIAHMAPGRFSDPVVLDWENIDDELVILQANFRQKNSKTVDSYLIASSYTNEGNSKEILAEYRVADSLQIGITVAIADASKEFWLILLGQIEFYIKPSGTISQDGDGFATLLMLVDKDRFTKTSGSSDVYVNHTNQVFLFPNPTSDFSTIVWQRPFSGQITITSLEGKVIQKINLSQESQYTLETYNWPSGMYLIRFDDVFEKTNYVKKLVK